MQNTEASVAFAGTFCIPATSNSVVNGAADLPGPGAVALPGSYKAHN